jgi:hypothetical protein
MLSVGTLHAFDLRVSQSGTGRQLRWADSGQALDNAADQAENGHDRDGPPGITELCKRSGRRTAVTARTAGASEPTNLCAKRILMTRSTSSARHPPGALASTAGDLVVWAIHDGRAVGIRDGAAASTISAA